MKPVFYSTIKKAPGRRPILWILAWLFSFVALAAGAFVYYAYQLEISEKERLQQEKAEKMSHYPAEIHATMEQCIGCHHAYKDQLTGPSFYLASARYSALGKAGSFEQFKKSVSNVRKQGGNYFVTLVNVGGSVIREASKRPCSASSRIPESEYRKVYDWMRTNKWDAAQYIADPKSGFIANGRYSRTTAANMEINSKW